MKGTYYNLTTGEITGYVKTPNPETFARLKTMKPGHGLAVGLFDPREDWVDPMTELPFFLTPNPATLAGNSVVGIPRWSTVSINEVGEWPVDDGVFAFTFSAPGMFSITVSSPRYLPISFELGII